MPSALEEERITAWLTENAIRLRGLEAGSGVGDLAPLADVLAEVRVLGLGEATHGSREFFTLKHRLVEFLVLRQGFTVFAIEAGWSACQAVNRYVLDGVGTAAEALRGLGYWTWHTEEVLGLIEWLREHNAGMPPGQGVRFRGIDPVIESSGVEASTRYLATVARRRAAQLGAAQLGAEQLRDEQLRDALRELGGAAPPSGLRGLARELGRALLDRIPWLPPRHDESAQRRTRARAVVHDTFAFLMENRNELTMASSAEAWAEAVGHLWALDRAAEIELCPVLGQAGSARRDRSMAEAVQRILDTEPPDARAIVWAHNGHIGLAGSTPGVSSLGSYLREQHRDRYYALGLACNEGSFQALQVSGKGYRGPVEFTLDPAKPGTVEWQLARPGLGDYLIDLRSARRDTRVATWIDRTSRMRSFGASLGFWPMLKRSTVPVRLAREYDGLAFIHRTNRARPLDP